MSAYPKNSQGRIAAPRQGPIVESLPRRVSIHHDFTFGDGRTQPDGAVCAGIRAWFAREAPEPPLAARVTYAIVALLILERQTSQTRFHLHARVSYA